MTSQELNEDKGAAVLALPMQPNDADAATVGEYLVRLLETLWREGDGFSGKRPFGNSGWCGDLMMPLIKAGRIVGTLDSDGWIDTCDQAEWDKGHRIIADAIRSLLAEPSGVSV